MLDLKPKPELKSCPTPTSLFIGREDILSQLHERFSPSPTSVLSAEQRVFVLYGLGGEWKTQIGLQFVHECQVGTQSPRYSPFEFHYSTFELMALCATSFSEVFFIDASTAETIDTDLRNIALAKEIGNTAEDAILWLAVQREEWLLLFDGADDAALNLRKFFPQCSHGNILITSRNPETRVHSPHFNCKVSDMTQGEATRLLLDIIMANVEVTDDTQSLAASIVKVHPIPDVFCLCAHPKTR